MIRLADPTEKQIRIQIAESVSLIAELDFPEKWPDLIDVSLGVISSFVANSHPKATSGLTLRYQL